MDNLWSPWRSEYITSTPSETCFLCSLIQGAKCSKETLALEFNEHCCVVLNRFPYNAGHLLVSPVEHVSEFNDLSLPVLESIAVVTQKAIVVLKKVLKPHGFNIGLNLGSAAGAGVPGHVHQHIVPRWNGDTNFMTTVSETKVISEQLESTWQKLFYAWKDL